MTETAHEVPLLGDWLSWNPEGLPTSGWTQLVPFVAWLFEHLSPQLSVELGSGDGQSLRILCQVAARFSRGGKVVAVDPWTADPQSPWRGNPVYEGLAEYLAARYADLASLLRVQLDEAVSEFDDGSVGFLHIARTDHSLDSPPWDPAVWMPKMQPGGVILITKPADEGPDKVGTKIWRQLSECYPSFSMELPRFRGVVQVPHGGNAPIVDTLHAGSASLSILFRLLGERLDYRHVLGTDPVSSGGLRRSISAMISEHTDDIRSIQAQHSAALGWREGQLASVSERLEVRSREADELQGEADYLLAKLATQSAMHERERAAFQSHLAEVQNRLFEAQNTSAQARAELELQFTTTLDERDAKHLADTSALQAEIGDREDFIEAIMNTRSWRLTKSLRTLQALRLAILRRSRRS